MEFDTDWVNTWLLGAPKAPVDDSVAMVGDDDAGSDSMEDDLAGEMYGN